MDKDKSGNISVFGSDQFIIRHDVHTVYMIINFLRIELIIFLIYFIYIGFCTPDMGNSAINPIETENMMQTAT